MNIGIFGATGFIGSYLLNKLSQHYTVRGFSSSVEDPSKKIMKSSYGSIDGIDCFTKNQDVAIYAAGTVNPREVMASSHDAIISSALEDLKRCLDIFYSNNQRGLFIYLSSAGALYENSFTENYREESTLTPLGFYGTLKLKQEELMRKKFADKNIIILRPCNVFGDPFKKNKATGVIDRLVVSCLSGEVVNIFESLSSERDYLYIKDLGTAVEKILGQRDQFEDRGVLTYNLSSHQMVKLGDVLENVQSYFSSGKARVCFTRIHEPSSWLMVDSTKFRQDIGWKPQYDFKAALADIRLTLEGKNA